MENWIENLAIFVAGEEEVEVDLLEEDVDHDVAFEDHGILVFNKAVKNVIEIVVLKDNIGNVEFDQQLYHFVC